MITGEGAVKLARECIVGEPPTPYVKALLDAGESSDRGGQMILDMIEIVAMTLMVECQKANNEALDKVVKVLQPLDGLYLPKNAYDSLVSRINELRV
jgi:hypothetical protein